MPLSMANYDYIIHLKTTKIYESASVYFLMLCQVRRLDLNQVSYAIYSEILPER